MQSAIRSAIEEMENLRRQANVDEPSFLNMALTDGRRAVVSRFSSDSADQATSLYVHSGGRYVCENGVCQMIEGQGAVIVSSEPLSKDPGWKCVPANHLVSVDEDLSLSIAAI
jgi:predicted glutamine amidotransferase